jgi:hypothetical protein
MRSHGIRQTRQTRTNARFDTTDKDTVKHARTWVPSTSDPERMLIALQQPHDGLQ